MFYLIKASNYISVVQFHTLGQTLPLRLNYHGGRLFFTCFSWRNNTYFLSHTFLFNYIEVCSNCSDGWFWHEAAYLMVLIFGAFGLLVFGLGIPCKACIVFGWELLYNKIVKLYHVVAWQGHGVVDVTTSCMNRSSDIKGSRFRSQRLNG